MAMTPEEIRVRGLQALKKELGTAGMVSFLQQYYEGSGDYAKDRHKLADTVTMADIVEVVQKKRRVKKQRTRKKPIAA